MHCDLKAPEDGVGGGPSRLAKEWAGDEALRIARVLRQAGTYPWCETYRMWPGPNSNTFVAWVLRQAGVEHTLDRRGIGKNYLTAKQ